MDKRVKIIMKHVRGLQITNMRSARGNYIPNQFELHLPGIGTIFQSYQSIIAVRQYGQCTILDRNRWDYSVTTSKYRNQFLGETTAETRRKIESGEYILADLN